MAYFSRLIAGLLFSLFTLSAFAAYESGGTPQVSGSNINTGNQASIEAACLQMGKVQGGPTNTTGEMDSYLGFIGGQHRWECKFVVFGTTVKGEAKQSCPGDYYMQFSGSQMKCFKTVPACKAGELPDPVTGICDVQCPAAGTQEGSSENAYQTSSKVPANNLCIGSCSWSAGGVVPSVCANGSCYYFGPFTSNGAKCSGQAGGPPGGEPPSPPEPSPPDDAGCVAKGQCPGTVNGVKICVPCSSKEGSSSESSSSSGSSTDSGGNTTPTGPTESTKETNAKCEGASCTVTTTTTTTAPDGSSTQTSTESTVPAADFCKVNPTHVVCKGKDESSWGGSCSGGFACSGDAVQCAQTKAAWISACAADTSGMSAQITEGTAAMAAGAASGLGIPGMNESFDLAGKISEVPIFGSSGGCPSDVSVSVGGSSYSLPFSRMCSQLQILGAALMAFAYLVAGFIVFRGAKT